MSKSFLGLVLQAISYIGTAPGPARESHLATTARIGSYPGEAAFDGSRQAYPDPKFASPNYTSPDTGIVYAFPGYTGPKKSDNVVSAGQTIPVAPAPYFSVSFLVSSDVKGSSISANATFTYSDGTSSLFELRAANWYSTLTIDRGLMIFPYRYTSRGVNWNTSHIFERTAALDPTKSLAAIKLPTVTGSARLHIFAVSLWQGDSLLMVQSVRPTQKWVKGGLQIVEVAVNNAGADCVAGSGVSVSLAGEGFQTVEAGRIRRLCPGDQKIAKVAVAGAAKNATATVLLEGTPINSTASTFSNIDIGLETWTADSSSLAKHEAPQWFDDSKFGIFIHWGPYAVTGWGNSTPHESYAEWFWYYSTRPKADDSGFYDYRLRTYGRDWAYDDTFPDFNASRFDAKVWVDLFADAGAKYFVITSKHHDGFALFDAGNTTKRSSLNYGPKRDILRELFDASAKYHPSLKRGTYFSLPEWFNPDFGPYGFSVSASPNSISWPGILAKNPYTGAAEPYTGRTPIGDYIADLMVPQMETLAYAYGTDIMWCDCGQANGTAEFAAKWWNAARAQDRQVAINSRCGIPEAADFDTPEYMTFRSSQRRKWESNMGMDPFSYGYNRATPAGAYMSPGGIVRALVDMASKNGNLLLDIGPMADGTVVQAEVDNLRSAGRWINTHGEAIFNTTYWFVQSEITGGGGGGQEVRFTQNDEAFYAIFLTKPVPVRGVVTVRAPVPIVEGDEVSLLTVKGAERLDWVSSGIGSSKILAIKVPEDYVDQDTFGWVFKIRYNIK